MKKPTVAIVTNSFPNHLQPHRGIFIKQMLDQIKEEIEPGIVCPLPWFPRLKVLRTFKNWNIFANIPRQYTWDGYYVRSPKYISIPKLSWPIAPALMVPGICGAIRRLFRERKVDLIHAHNVFPEGVAAAWIGQHLGIPVILSARGSDINGPKENSAMRSWQIRWAARRAAMVTGVSQALCEKVISMGVDRERVIFIRNGVDRGKFHIRDRVLCKQRLKLDPSRKILLFVGKLRGVKGLRTLVKALAILKKRNEVNFQTVLIGRGPMEEELRRNVEQAGLNGKVSFAGNVPHEVVGEWLAASDLLCLPSVKEGTPNVVLEALSCGLPVIATRVGGIPEVVDKKSGILIPPEDAESLAEAIVAGFRRTWDRFSISRSKELLGWDESGKRYLDVIKRSVAGNSIGARQSNVGRITAGENPLYVGGRRSRW